MGSLVGPFLNFDALGLVGPIEFKYFWARNVLVSGLRPMKGFGPNLEN